MSNERREAKAKLDTLAGTSNILGFDEGKWYPMLGETPGGVFKILDNHNVVRFMLGSHWEVRTVKD
jgi:hypothetical protein